eukprot:TRINITY_DN5619_c0_g1_i1.p1 TRINITY_DN5619_c0_g1~~TRINITY_DN5619_c0_g1_i1.p1  ORF type:complete len:194 (+),score=55.67 TRINITY_DN5619_c0_g1_i1:28-582(+)
MKFISIASIAIFVFIICCVVPESTHGLIPGPEVCHACNATIVEIKLKIPKFMRREKGNREISVVSSMERICDMDNFKVYDYAPPKMIHACEDIMGEFDEELEKLLVADDPEIHQKFCHEITKACEFNPEEIEEEEPTMMVDGRPIKMERKSKEEIEEEEKPDNFNQKDDDDVPEEGDEKDKDEL